MARKTRDPFDVRDPLGGDALPVGDRRLPDTDTRRQPGDETMGSAQGFHAAHGANIRAPVISRQAPNIAADDLDLGQNSNMSVADTIRLARQRLKLRQVDLARMLGVRQSAVSQWESGKYNPELDARIRLGAVLNISLNDLLPEAGDIPPEMFRDPQVRRLIEHYCKLEPQLRQAVDLLVERLHGEQQLDAPDPWRPPAVRRRRR